VAGSRKYGHEPSGSGTTELVSKLYIASLFQCLMATVRVLGTYQWDLPRSRLLCGSRVLTC
jgi:hypothetical protein